MPPLLPSPLPPALPLLLLPTLTKFQNSSRLIETRCVPYAMNTGLPAWLVL